MVEFARTNAATTARHREDQNFRAQATALANEEAAAQRKYVFDQAIAVDAAKGRGARAAIKTGPTQARAAPPTVTTTQVPAVAAQPARVPGGVFEGAPGPATPAQPASTLSTVTAAPAPAPRTYSPGAQELANTRGGGGLSQGMIDAESKAYAAADTATQTRLNTQEDAELKATITAYSGDFNDIRAFHNAYGGEIPQWAQDQRFATAWAEGLKQARAMGMTIPREITEYAMQYAMEVTGQQPGQGYRDMSAGARTTVPVKSAAPPTPMGEQENRVKARAAAVKIVDTSNMTPEQAALVINQVTEQLLQGDTAAPVSEEPEQEVLPPEPGYGEQAWDAIENFGSALATVGEFAYDEAAPYVEQAVEAVSSGFDTIITEAGALVNEGFSQSNDDQGTPGNVPPPVARPEGMNDAEIYALARAAKATKNHEQIAKMLSSWGLDPGVIGL